MGASTEAQLWELYAFTAYRLKGMVMPTSAAKRRAMLYMWQARGEIPPFGSDFADYIMGRTPELEMTDYPNANDPILTGIGEVEFHHVDVQGNVVGSLQAVL